MCHLFHILWPVLIELETGTLPSPRKQRMFCRQVSCRVFCLRRQSQTGYSRSCLQDATHRYGSLRCRNCQRGASFGPRVLPILTRLASSANCPQTHLVLAGRSAVAPGGSGRLKLKSSPPPESSCCASMESNKGFSKL